MLYHALHKAETEHDVTIPYLGLCLYLTSELQNTFLPGFSSCWFMSCLFCVFSSLSCGTRASDLAE